MQKKREQHAEENRASRCEMEHEMSKGFAPGVAQTIAANLSLPLGGAANGRQEDKPLITAYVVVGRTPTQEICECVSVRVWKTHGSVIAFVWVTNGSVSWSANGSASGGGYNRITAAIEDAVTKIVGRTVELRRSGGSTDTAVDGLAALAIVAGFTPELVIRL